MFYSELDPLQLLLTRLTRTLPSFTSTCILVSKLQLFLSRQVSAAKGRSSTGLACFSQDNFRFPISFPSFLRHCPSTYISSTTHTHSRVTLRQSSSRYNSLSFISSNYTPSNQPTDRCPTASTRLTFPIATASNNALLRPLNLAAGEFRCRAEQQHYV